MDSRTSAAQDLLAMAQEALIHPTAHTRPESQDTLSTLSASHKTERSKFSSPVPPTSSITPPPSSQVAPVVPAMRTSVRTPTPPTPVLSSPPPTSRTSTQLSGPALSFTLEQINSATVEELRDMVGELLTALREARTSAAHHKLQYNMLSIDSAEAQNRMAVELAMTQREVEVLQQPEERRRNAPTTTTNTAAPPVDPEEPAIASANTAMLNEMTRHIQALQNENQELRGMLEQSKCVTEKREGEIASLLEQNERLRGRIRKNRDHINGILGEVYEAGSPVSVTGTPRYPTTPRSRNRAQAMADPGRERQAFEALLLADQMLSAKTATAPTTPNKATGRMGHTRGSHSLPSIPATPNRTSEPTGSQNTVAVPRTPPTSSFHAINHPPQPTSAMPVSHPRRRESTDSTITASSVEDNVVNESDKDTEIIESQASQMASSMLRRTPQHFTSSASPHASQSHSQPHRSTSATMQTRLFGHVKKPGVSRPSLEKRNISGVEDHHDGRSPAKRGRIAEPGIGLGIGGMSGSPKRS
ncbi:hypothetical protein IWZ01DRAFT_489279 [Phyllosticta capitalensis]